MIFVDVDLLRWWCEELKEEKINSCIHKAFLWYIISYKNDWWYLFTHKWGCLAKVEKKERKKKTPSSKRAFLRPQTLNSHCHYHYIHRWRHIASDKLNEIERKYACIQRILFIRPRTTIKVVVPIAHMERTVEPCYENT